MLSQRTKAMNNENPAYDLTANELQNAGMLELSRILCVNNEPKVKMTNAKKIEQDKRLIEVFENMAPSDQRGMHKACHEEKVNEEIDNTYEARNESRVNFQEHLVQYYLHMIIKGVREFKIEECRKLIKHCQVFDLAEELEDAMNEGNIDWRKQNRDVSFNIKEKSSFNGCYYIVMKDVRLDEAKVEEGKNKEKDKPFVISRRKLRIPMGTCTACGRAGQQRTECPGCKTGETFKPLNFHTSRSHRFDRQGIIDPLNTARCLRPNDDTAIVIPVLSHKSEEALRWSNILYMDLKDFLSEHSEYSKGHRLSYEEGALKLAARAMKVDYDKLQKVWIRVRLEQIGIRSADSDDEEDAESVACPDKNTIGPLWRTG